MSLQLAPSSPAAPTPTVESPPGELNALASEIRREHEVVVAGVRATLEAAIRCGNLLREAKAKVGHGGWGAWLAGEFPASDRTARIYVRLAKHYEDRQLPADLTIDGALKQLSAPKLERSEDQGDDGPYPVLSDDEIEAKAQEAAEATRTASGSNSRLAELEERIAYNFKTSELLSKKAGYGYLNLAARLEPTPGIAAIAERLGHLYLAAPEPWELAEEKAKAQFQLDEAVGELLPKLREINDAELRRWVEVEGKTQTEIAEMVGLSPQWVSDRCRKLGITPEGGER